MDALETILFRFTETYQKPKPIFFDTAKVQNNLEETKQKPVFNIPLTLKITTHLSKKR